MNSVSGTGQPRVVKQGWVEKKGEYLKNWAKRYLVLYDNGILNGYKTEPSPQEIAELGGKHENKFNVKDNSIIRLEDGLGFKIRCRQQDNQNGNIERSFRCSSGREDRDDWCDKIEQISTQCRSHRGSMSSSDMCVDQPVTESTVHDIEMPMAPELKQASRKMTKESFQRVKVLGKGSFGEVFLVYKKSDGPDSRRMAMKVVKKRVVRENEEIDHMRNERAVLGATNHRFLIRLYHAFQTADALYFVMEFAQGGEVYTMLARSTTFPLNQCRFYGAEITCAFQYLHERAIIYRDLKLENILLADDGHIKITDFGLCKYLLTPERTTQTFCGTPEYLAPEVLMDKNYNVAVDWWSLGVVLHEMIVGKLPFNAPVQDDLFDKICESPLQELPARVPLDANNLLQGLLHKEPQRRLGGGDRDALEVMEHEFFASIDFERLKRCEITPPYVPRISGRDDTNGFDRHFTEIPINSYQPESYPNRDEGDFNGFSYRNAEHSHTENEALMA